MVNGLTIGIDGRGYVRDQARIIVFDDNGTFLDQWPNTTSLASDHMLTADRDGRLAMKFLEEVGEPFQDLSIGFVVYEDGAAADTVPGPRTVWDAVAEL